ncbi:hypothetical protein [Vibrio sagamiensis]|uniref:Knr4/Smi1-like domain-containing protein n=1 Tax=Vibrio sagamiensis NBRC 104589 TaxID=1219064 RepID=A0A511QFR5_9VIBR|nr:hypothetical protein [Vibrio sagamiensis]PNQ62653.1 hypothetical protein C1141_10490 [Vibrio agarivorans]GEM76154.1 hypothetical protein VSA01S_22660 [Vibrio sagamiensis NBRC 104589]
MNIRDKLVELGVKPSEQYYPTQNELPKNVEELVKIYKHSVLFYDDIIFVPQYLTGLEDKKKLLSVEVLWGLEDGNFNIFDENESLEDLEADEHLYSIGGSFGGIHICLSKNDDAVYFFVNDSEENTYKIFDNLQLFIEALKIGVL